MPLDAGEEAMMFPACVTVSQIDSKDLKIDWPSWQLRNQIVSCPALEPDSQEPSKSAAVLAEELRRSSGGTRWLAASFGLSAAHLRAHECLYWGWARRHGMIHFKWWFGGFDRCQISDGWHIFAFRSSYNAETILQFDYSPFIPLRYPSVSPLCSLLLSGGHWTYCLVHQNSHWLSTRASCPCGGFLRLAA